MEQLSFEQPDLHPIVDDRTISFVIADVARANDMQAHIDKLVRQCAAESSFNIAARNARSDCYGLFQLSAAAANQVHVNRYDWRDNIVGGVKYMAWLLAQFHGQYDKALAAYNWGLGHVAHAVALHADHWREYLPAETASYITKILVVK